MISILKTNYHRLNKAVNLIKFQIKPVKIDGTDYRTKVFFINRLALHEEHEPWMDAAYSAALNSKKGIFIDVGANTGQTLLKVLSFDRDREYLGFEPQLDCCYFIEKFIKENNLHTHSTSCWIVKQIRSITVTETK